MATKAKMGPIYKGAKVKVVDFDEVVLPLLVMDVVQGESVEQLGKAKVIIRGDLSLTSDFLASVALETLKGLLETKDAAVVGIRSREEKVLVTYYSRSHEYRKEVDDALLCWRDHAYQQTDGPYTAPEWVGTWVYDGDLPWDEVRPSREEPELPYPRRRKGGRR